MNAKEKCMQSSHFNFILGDGNFFFHVRTFSTSITLSTHLNSILLCGAITYVQRSTYKVILNIDNEESIYGSNNLWTKGRKKSLNRWKRKKEERWKEKRQSELNFQFSSFLYCVCHPTGNSFIVNLAVIRWHPICE